VLLLLKVACEPARLKIVEQQAELGLKNAMTPPDSLRMSASSALEFPEKLTVARFVALMVAAFAPASFRKTNAPLSRIMVDMPAVAKLAK